MTLRIVCLNWLCKICIRVVKSFHSFSVLTKVISSLHHTSKQKKLFLSSSCKKCSECYPVHSIAVRKTIERKNQTRTQNNSNTHPYPRWVENLRNPENLKSRTGRELPAATEKRTKTVYPYLCKHSTRLLSRQLQILGYSTPFYKTFQNAGSHVLVK